jgi:hypothetical protein
MEREKETNKHTQCVRAPAQKRQEEEAGATVVGARASIIHMLSVRL